MLFSCKYCQNVATENTCYFIKHSELISFFYKNKSEKKRNSAEIIQLTYEEKEVRNSRVAKSSYETELRQMKSHFELLTRSRKMKTYTSTY